MSTEEQGKHFVITLMFAPDEDPQDYVRRCQDVASYARERSSDSIIDISPPPDIEGAPRFEDVLSARDTHFAGFARLLWDGIQRTMHRSVLAVEPFIAHASYDFAFHVLAYMPASKRAEYGDVPDCLEHVPDLTEWPEHSE